jgi:Tol biopolymer transport system component
VRGDSLLIGLLALAAVPVGAVAQSSDDTTERVSLGAAGQADSASFNPSLSADGRLVAFASDATNLVAGDTNGVRDIFVRDGQTAATELVSLGGLGPPANGGNFFPAISADGRYVAFQSVATNLVGGDNNGASDVFVRDRQTGLNERVSVRAVAVDGNADSALPAISSDGRYVSFVSLASNLVLGDANGTADVFVRDRVTGATERVSVGTGGTEANGASTKSAISADGRFVAFASDATNVVAGDTNANQDVFVRDRQTGTTERVSVAGGGDEGDGGSGGPSISSDGNLVAFTSGASNLVDGDDNGDGDVFVRDRAGGDTERVSVDSAGEEVNGASSAAAISGDGTSVVFESNSKKLVVSDTNGRTDVFVRDRVARTTERVSLSDGDAQVKAKSQGAAIGSDGRFIAFESFAAKLVSGDTNGNADVFVRDRPPPVLGKSVSTVPVSGEVLVSVPKSSARAAASVPGLKGREFVPLSEVRELPVGSLLDTRDGTVRLTTAGKKAGTTQSGSFSSGVFQVLQKRKGKNKGLTTLRLKGASFKSCRGSAAAASAVAQAARRKLSGRTIRRLSGNAKGRFRTRGRHSAATVRGTKWTVADRCDGTLTKVKRGRVAVRDFRRQRTIVVRAGKSYLARR